MSAGLRLAVVTTVVGCAMGLPTVARAADDGLVPPASDLPGFKAAASGAKVGVSAAGGRTVKALKGAKVAGAAYRAKGQQLSFGWGKDVDREEYTFGFFDPHFRSTWTRRRPGLPRSAAS